MKEPPISCAVCEDVEFTTSECPECGWEYEPPMDYAERMYESAVRSALYRQDLEKSTIKALMQGD